MPNIAGPEKELNSSPIRKDPLGYANITSGAEQNKTKNKGKHKKAKKEKAKKKRDNLQRGNTINTIIMVATGNHGVLYSFLIT